MAYTAAQLEQRWWHRLAKVTFIASTILVVLVVGLFSFYAQEPYEEYTIVKTFAQYIGETEAAARTVREEYKGTLVIKDSFLGQRDMQGASLGCRMQDGTVRILLEFVFKESVQCDDKAHTCVIPPSVCGGGDADIVRYTYSSEYRLQEYLAVAGRTGIAAGVWMAFWYFVYYRVILYVVFGSRSSE